MLTLIAREIRDNLVYLLAFCAISLVTIGILVTMFLNGMYGPAIPFAALMLLVLFLGFSVLGMAQMYGDRANRISPLLSTLAVTRDRIFAARVLAGGFAILLALVPILITAVVLLRLFVPPFEFYQRMVVEISIASILMAVACYSIGLVVGGTTSRIWLIVGTLLLLALCVSLFVAKGFGPSVMLILVALIGALLVRTSHTFISASL
jgi:hypothetical protein